MNYRVMARLSWVAALFGLVALASPACAQSLNDQAPVAPPASMTTGEFSLDKAGQVETPTDLDARTTPIAPAQTFTEEDEERPVAAPEPEPAPPPRALASEVMALDSNMGQRVNDVLACRLEIAADRRVEVGQVPAGTVLLRWTITPTGTVTGAEAVAIRKTDPDVLSCARRKAEAWTFVRRPGAAPAQFQHSIRFE